MRLVFVTEASPSAGHGHVFRCRSLALAARARHIQTEFCAADDYTVKLLLGLGEAEESVIRDETSSSGDCVLIDLPYAVSGSRARGLRERGAVVVLLDALGEARTSADLVCDAMMTRARSSALPHSHSTIYLYGLPYACIDRRYGEWHGCARPGTRHPPRLLVAFGGSEPTDSTVRFLEALDRRGFRGPATVVCGGAGDASRRAGGVVRKWRETVVETDVRDMPRKMLESDLVVTKLGLTLLESLSMGVGCVTVEPTPAHVELQSALQAEYKDWPVTTHGLASDAAFAGAAETTINLLGMPTVLVERGRQGALLVDGHGTERLLAAVENAVTVNRETARGA